MKLTTEEKILLLGVLQNEKNVLLSDFLKTKTAVGRGEIRVMITRIDSMITKINSESDIPGNHPCKSLFEWAD